jgi:hypothetical protein
MPSRIITKAKRDAAPVDAPAASPWDYLESV